MNWKVNLVLLYGKLRKPVDPDVEHDITLFRKKSDRAVQLGTWLFDKKVAVSQVHDTSANGVPVRIYKNSNSENQRTIIYYHGGGFVLYGIYSHDNVCRRLCAMNNCIVVSVDYRLAPEHTFPIAHHDSFEALIWVRNHIKNYGGNANNIVVCGDSAGGNIAACMAHRCKKENIPLKAQVLIYPWVDGRLSNPSLYKNGEGYLLERKTVVWFRQQYTPNIEDRLRPEVSVIDETDFTNLAPAFVLTAQFDPLLDDGFQYYQKLRAGGNPAAYKEYANLFHSFFNLPGVHPNAMLAYTDIKTFLSEIK